MNVNIRGRIWQTPPIASLDLPMKEGATARTLVGEGGVVTAKIAELRKHSDFDGKTECRVLVQATDTRFSGAFGNPTVYVTSEFGLKLDDHFLLRPEPPKTSRAEEFTRSWEVVFREGYVNFRSIHIALRPDFEEPPIVNFSFPRLPNLERLPRIRTLWWELGHLEDHSTERPGEPDSLETWDRSRWSTFAVPERAPKTNSKSADKTGVQAKQASKASTSTASPSH